MGEASWPCLVSGRLLEKLNGEKCTIVTLCSEVIVKCSKVAMKSENGSEVVVKQKCTIAGQPV